jgi:putative SOS response-associated peptidase YedK
MPAILLPGQERLWIDPSLSAKEAMQLIIPYPDEEMSAYAVSDRVGKVSENDSGLIEEITSDPQEHSSTSNQLDLFG